MKIGFNMLLWSTNLVEDEFHLLEKIKQDQRKVHLVPTKILITQMSEYIRRFKEFYAQTKF